MIFSKHTHFELNGKKPSVADTTQGWTYQSDALSTPDILVVLK